MGTYPGGVVGTVVLKPPLSARRVVLVRSCQLAFKSGKTRVLLLRCSTGRRYIASMLSIRKCREKDLRGKYRTRKGEESSIEWDGV